MIAQADYTGMAALVAAFTGLVAAIGVLWNGRTAKQVHDAVKTANGQTLGQLVENTAVQQAVKEGLLPGEGQTDTLSTPDANERNPK